MSPAIARSQNAVELLESIRAQPGCVVAGTGHRPPRLGLGYNNKSRRYLVDFVRPRLAALKPTLIVSGGAQGFDQALGWAAIELGLPLLVAVPFEGQESKWPTDAQHIYRDLLRRAEHVVTICDGPYHPKKFHERDHFMVECADIVCALFDGARSGGTWETVSYAQSRIIQVLNWWEEYSPPV